MCEVGCLLPPSAFTRLLLLLQVWDLAAGSVRQTIERAHSGDLACVTHMLVWESHLLSSSLDGRIKIWEPADPNGGAVVVGGGSLVPAIAR